MPGAELSPIWRRTAPGEVQQLAVSRLEEVEPSVDTDTKRREVRRCRIRPAEALHDVAVASGEAHLTKAVLYLRQFLFQKVVGEDSLRGGVCIGFQIGRRKRQSRFRRPRRSHRISIA